MINLPTLGQLTAIMFAASLLGACASPGAMDGEDSRPAPNTSRISVCKSTDTQIDDRSQCLQDDAACYALNNGKWCTGERGNTCPAGSSPLPAAVACPAGKRCFQVSESLECAIN